jgi:predicted Zn-dependent peptidase
MAPQTAERRSTIEDPRADLPAFHIAYHIPPRRTPDHYALEILASILSDGESSRLYQQLIKERQVASSIEVETDDRRGPDLFTVWCVLSQGHTAAEVIPLVLQAFDDVAHNGITGHELDKARNRIRAAFVFGLQSNLQRASHLSEFELYDGNARLLRTELDRYLAVTLEDVRRVAAQYLVATNRTILEVIPTRGASSPAPSGSPAPGAP